MADFHNTTTTTRPEFGSKEGYGEKQTPNSPQSAKAANEGYAQLPPLTMDTGHNEIVRYGQAEYLVVNGTIEDGLELEFSRSASDRNDGLEESYDSDKEDDDESVEDGPVLGDDEFEEIDPETGDIIGIFKGLPREYAVIAGCVLDDPEWDANIRRFNAKMDGIYENAELNGDNGDDADDEEEGEETIVEFAEDIENGAWFRDAKGNWAKDPEIDDLEWVQRDDGTWRHISKTECQWEQIHDGFWRPKQKMEAKAVYHGL